MKHINAFALPLIAVSVSLAGAGATLAQVKPTPPADQTTPPSPPPAQDSLPPAPDATQDSTDQSPAAPAPAADAPVVGGAPMLPTRTIVENASAASNLTTLVSAIKAAGLTSTLSSAGPFTVFAPTNEAFGRLAPGTIDKLLKPANKATLTKLLTYHVVAGTITLDDLRTKAAAGGGKTVLTTVEGDPLTVTVADKTITLTDTNGNKSYIETADVRQSNGIVHVVNGVVLPKLS